MKNTIFQFCIQLFLFLSLPMAIIGQELIENNQPDTSEQNQLISAPGLQEDFEILKKAYQSLHPGFYKHTDSVVMERYFKELERSLLQPLTIGQAYLIFSKFLAKVKCGHTYCNFWNQPEIVKEAIFDRKDKLPFTYRLVQKRMIVTKNASQSPFLKEGLEIKAINGVRVGRIIDSLITVVKADGANDRKRIYDLQLSGTGQYEAADVYFPLLFPPVNGAYLLETYSLLDDRSAELSVQPITREERKAILAKRYGPQPDNPDQLWRFEILDEKVGYLKLGTHVVWKMDFKWKAFLADAFADLRTKQIQHLIVDVRGNEGGASEVNLVLGQYLTREPIMLPESQSIVKYDVVPPDLVPHLGTWDKSFYDIRKQVRPIGDGYFTTKRQSDSRIEITPNKKSFRGKTYLLVDAANSSATFTLAKYAKEYELATLIGTETGGSQKGITGGRMFFLTLPNSQIEMDIPLMTSFASADTPDAGITPDIWIEETVEDVINGKDAFLNKALEIIARDQ